MKKYLILLMILTSAFLFSCSQGESGDEGATGPSASGDIVAYFQNGMFPTSTYNVCLDARIWDAAANTNYGTNTSSNVGRVSNSIKRFAIFYPVTLLPSDITVKRVFLTLYCINALSSVSPFSFYPITSVWSETDITWNDNTAVTSWITPGGDHDPVSVSDIVTVDTDSAYYTWEISAATVQGWVDNTATNIGLLMKATDEVTVGNFEAIFATSENANVAYRPKLTVIYTSND